MRTNVFTFFFSLCLMLPFAGVAQQGYLHNGFVAATNNGVYYLQDGFNEWVQLNNEESMGISFNKQTLLSKQSFGFNKIYGLKNKFDFTSQQLSPEFDLKMFASKFNLKKWDYLGDLVIDFDNSYYGLMGYWYNNRFTWSNPMIVVNKPVLATDNDSTLVIVGTNNTLRKLVFSSSYLSMSYSAMSVPGLTSNSASAHQICYNSDDNYFFIVSDEGKVYTYNHTTNEVEDEFVIDNCDSVSDISYNSDMFRLTINYHNTLENEWYSYNFDTYEWASDGEYSLMTDNTYPILSAEGKNTTMTINTIGQVVKNTGDYNYTQMTNSYLPNGTIVYDLDYIDYMPCERGIYFQTPQKDDVFYIGQEYTFKWNSCKSVDPKSVDLFRYDNGNYTYQENISGMSTGDSVTWTIPYVGSLTDYMIFVNDYNYTSAYSEQFTITLEPLITITFPQEGSYLINNQNYTITWTAQGVPGNVKIELIEYGVVKETISTMTSNDGSYPYKPCCYYQYPEYTAPPVATFKIRITSLSSGQYWESGLFTISDHT